MVKEVGEVEEDIVVNELISEMRREIRNVSSAPVRYMVQFPYAALRTAIRKQKREPRKSS